METATNENAVAAAADKLTTQNEKDINQVGDVPLTDERSAEEKSQEELWKADLARLEYEIQTLRNVLIAKMNEAGELKRKLGITPMVELKQDLKTGIQSIKESETVKKTNAAFKSFGDFASRKLDDLRNSNTFKSVEEKVGTAYTNVRKRVSVSKTDDNFNDQKSPTELAASPVLDTGSKPDIGEELANLLPEPEKTDTAAVVAASTGPEPTTN